MIQFNQYFVILSKRYIFQVAERNRGIYRRLRTELESLAEGGVYLGRKMQENGANIMQKLAVDILCNQLDETWNYFTTTFKMQDRIYVQFVNSISLKMSLGS